MLWRGIEVGPPLARGEREERIGFDSVGGVPLHLRWFPSVPAELALPPTPWPPEISPNLARVVRFERSGVGALVASELALGPTLDLVLGAPQPLAVVAGLVSQVLSGLEVLHRAGRAHGRIHPGNLVLDVDAGCLRIVDLWAGWLEGLARGADVHKLYVRPGSAARPPAIGDDIYAAGRVAEALVRGGPPLGEWSRLEPSRGDSPELFRRFTGWIERCQSLQPAEAFGSCAEAQAALRELGVDDGQSHAQVRSGRWVGARRRAVRTLARWRLGTRSRREGPREFEELLSSLRASWLWRRLGGAAVGACVLSALIASKPHLPQVPDADWTEDACVEEARPKILAAAEEPAAGRVAVELQGAAGAPLAIDGCPLLLPTPPPLRISLAPGRHELRARVGEGLVAESFPVGASPAKIVLGELPRPAADAAAAKEVAARLKRILETLAGGAQPEVAVLAGADPMELAFLSPTVAAVLAADPAGPSASGARAALPDDLALELDALRAASSRFRTAAAPCRERLDAVATTALAVRQPGARATVREAVDVLAALRIGGEGGRSEVDVRSQLGIDESPMLDAAVDQVASDEELKRCVAPLGGAAAGLLELAERCLAAQGGASALMGLAPEPEPESSSGSAR